MALDRLRKKLSGWCTEAGLAKAPLMAFERWRFAAKWREEEEELRQLKQQQQQEGGGKAATGGGKGKKPGGGGGLPKAASLPSDPVLPSTVSGSETKAAAPSSTKWVKGETKKVAPPPSSSSLDPGEGLARDLVQAGMMPASAASAIAERLSATCHEIAASVAKRAHQLASGRPTGKEAAAVVVSFHRNTVDLTTGGGHFVKINRDAYCRLAKMYRRNRPASDAAPPPLPPPLASVAEGGERPSAEAAEDDAAEAAEAARLAGKGGDAETGPAGGYRDFHNRLFALLLRYKSIQGHGYQASSYRRP